MAVESKLICFHHDSCAAIHVVSSISLFELGLFEMLFSRSRKIYRVPSVFLLRMYQLNTRGFSGVRTCFGLAAKPALRS